MSACHVDVSTSPVTGRPCFDWKSCTAAWVWLPKAPSTDSGSPADWRCSCAQRTRSFFAPFESGAQSVAGGTPLYGGTVAPTASQFDADALSQSHQLTPGEPCIDAICRNRVMSAEEVLL